MDAAEAERVLQWADVIAQVDYYAILGIDARADHGQLKQAFHAFALAFHPDSHPDVPEPLHSALRRVFHEGAEAYRVLSDPELRIRYDLGLTRGELRPRRSQIPQTVDPGMNRKSLDELCRSAGAKLCAQRASKLIDQGDLVAAKRALEEALAYDGHANPALSERLEALELSIYAAGA
jgi:curved DNA-binding protein CbpA